MAEGFVYDLEPDEAFASLDDLPEDCTLESCPVCEGGDTLLTTGTSVIDDCPACTEGYIPHGRCLDTEEIDEERS